MAAFYGRFKRLRIFDAHLNLLRDVEVQIPPFHTAFDNPSTSEWPVYYGSPQAVGNYIYVHCANY